MLVLELARPVVGVEGLVIGDYEKNVGFGGRTRPAGGAFLGLDGLVGDFHHLARLGRGTDRFKEDHRLVALVDIRARRPALLDGLKEIGYFQNNREEMRYADFRAQGLFVGSGVVEAGCKTLIGKRLKNSGMFWSLDGANAIIASRCCQYSGRFEQYWEDRAPTEATGEDQTKQAV